MSERALVQEIVAERPKRVYSLCVFCAAPCYGTACQAHKDLLRLDPHYALKGRAA